MVKEKWLIVLIYYAPSQKNKYFFWYLTTLLEFYFIRYEKVIIFDHFNIETESKNHEGFPLEAYVLQYDKTEYMF